MYASAEELIAEEYAVKVLTIFDVGINKADKSAILSNLAGNYCRFEQLEIDSQPKLVLKNFCVRFVDHIDSESEGENKGSLLESFYRDNSEISSFRSLFRNYLSFNRRFVKKFDNFNFVNSFPVSAVIVLNSVDANDTDVLTRAMSTFFNYFKKATNYEAADLIEHTPVLFLFIGDNSTDKISKMNEMEKNFVSSFSTDKTLNSFRPEQFRNFLTNKTFPALIGRHTILLQNLVRIKKVLVSSNLLSTAREFFKYGVNNNKSQRYFPMFHPEQTNIVKAFNYLSVYIKNRSNSGLMMKRTLSANFEDKSKSKRENQKSIYYSKFRTIKEIADILFMLKVHTNCHTIYSKLKKQNHEFLPTELSYAAMEMSLYCKIFTGKFEKKPFNNIFAECEFVLKWYNANSIFTAVRFASVMAEKLCQRQKNTEAFLILNSLNTRQQADWPILLQRAAYCYEKSMPRKFYYQIIFAGVQYFVMGRLGFSYECFQPVKRSSLELFRKNWHNMTLFALINLSSLLVSFNRGEESVREILHPLMEFVSDDNNVLSYFNCRQNFFQDVLKIVFKTCLVNEMSVEDKKELQLYKNWVDNVFGLVFFFEGGYEVVAGNFTKFYVLNNDNEKVGVRMNKFYFNLEFVIESVVLESEEGGLVELMKKSEDESYIYFEFGMDKERVTVKGGIFDVGLKLNNTINKAKIKIDTKTFIFETIQQNDVIVNSKNNNIQYETTNNEVEDIILVCKNFTIFSNCLRRFFNTDKDSFYVYQVNKFNRYDINIRSYYNNYKEISFVSVVRYKNGFCRVLQKTVQDVEKYRNYIINNENLIRCGDTNFSVSYSYEKVATTKDYLNIYTANNLKAVDNIFSIKLNIKNSDQSKVVSFVSSEYFTLIKEEIIGNNSFHYLLSQKKMLSTENKILFKVDEDNIYLCDINEINHSSALLKFEYPVVVNHKFTATNRCRTVELIVRVKEIESALVDEKNECYLCMVNNEKGCNYGAYLITGPCKVALFDTKNLNEIKYSVTIFRHRSEPFDLNGNFYIWTERGKIPITNILPLYVRNAE